MLLVCHRLNVVVLAPDRVQEFDQRALL